MVLSHRLPFPPNKGEKIRTYNQLEHLRMEGCKITLFCTVDSAEEQRLARDYENETGFTIIFVKSGFRKPSMLLGMLTGRPLSVTNFYNRALQKRFDGYLLENSADAIYCTSSAMAEYVFRGESAVRMRDDKRRDLIDFMDLDSDKWRQYREVSGFLMSLIYRYEVTTLARYESRIQKRFDECIFISINETRLFSSQLKTSAENLKVIGNGVDLTAFRPPDSPRQWEGTTLLFSGVMDYLPNENAMLWFVEHVWPKLSKGHPDVRLVIAGMNPSQPILDLAKDDRITVTGYVDDMLAYYHEANIFVAPFQIARGVQNKILQAFACSLPVVTTAFGAEGIDCTDGTHYLQANEPEQFIEKINQLIEDRSCYNRISCKALELVTEQFTWESSNRKLYRLFNSSGGR
ncbi:TIGR03087 family PEP-CTERM/XrtA system glycosyltransferase [Granulosicoccus sp.]|nr:TIGR03087 family PEP-CTERM/XrtA system glycosyltransferase [Granulosicoccus sp.]MDB4224529.1 TIGR03087 family PEP-CTERM/XrtA system glycosyltransferase [Granulosicoccus sp.]